jgi:hypothetical protein
MEFQTFRLLGFLILLLSACSRDEQADTPHGLHLVMMCRNNKFSGLDKHRHFER